MERFETVRDDDMFGDAFYSSDVNTAIYDDDDEDEVDDAGNTEDDRTGRRCQSSAAFSWTRQTQ